MTINQLRARANSVPVLVTTHEWESIVQDFCNNYEHDFSRAPWQMHASLVQQSIEGILGRKVVIYQVEEA